MTYVPIPLPNRVNIQKNEAINVVSDEIGPAKVRPRVQWLSGASLFWQTIGTNGTLLVFA